MKRPTSKPTGSAGAAAASGRRTVSLWSADGTRRSKALDLEADVFTLDDAREIARRLKRSAQASERRKSPPFRSAMSMLIFYMNRAVRNLSDERRRVLERAKDELRREFACALDE